MLSVKQLFAGIILIIVLGVGGFMYRYAMENRPQGDGGQVACTMEARLCPDGTSVGRQGPACEFAPCPPPNVELGDLGIAYAVPAGYTQVASGAAGQDLLRLYSKASASESVQHSISVRRYPIPEGKTADEVILENTRFQPADMNAEDFSRFETVTIGGKSFRIVVIERFEALVQSSYFLARENDVLRFDIVEHDVTEWTSPDLEVRELPEHRALESLLGTLQVR